jgi:DNA polymerase II large subunit
LNIDQYFKLLDEDFNKAYVVARSARAKGLDPREEVEIRPAPDLASRVEGLTNITGIAAIIRRVSKDQSRTKLAFEVAKEICTGKEFDEYDRVKRMDMAVKVGTAVLTEGILVAPTEGIQTIKLYRNADNTEYVAVVYAGPIRGAGGTAAAQSVALADYARRFFGIGTYKATQDEIERYVEETELYHTRAARLQYRPPDDDIRVIVSNCPICIDGVPTEQMDVGVHGNLKRLGEDGREVPITNRVRGGVPLVICEGIAQKAKKLLKEVKGFGLEWDWLNNIIKIEVKKADSPKTSSVFLEDLAAGRPILAYPSAVGGFRLRYGRSRMTGIAAKGFSPATMIITNNFISVGTQVKVEYPGKGCIATPVDSVEGPFVVLSSGEALRVNDAETAMKVKESVKEIISMGDILIAYGDFKKSNSQLRPTSYVEELWELQLKEKEKDFASHDLTFKEAYGYSLKYGIPMHPRYLYEFQAVGKEALEELSVAVLRESGLGSGTIFDVDRLLIDSRATIKRTLELLTVPHRLSDGKILVDREYAQSLIASLGYVSGTEGRLEVNELVADRWAAADSDTLGAVNSISPFKIMRRSTFLGARIGRPEKARERLMKPAPNVLFPISAYGGKERNITSAYMNDSKRFKSSVKVDIARYRCASCKRLLNSQFCHDCGRRAFVERVCQDCKQLSLGRVCENCGGKTIAYEEREVELVKLVADAMKRTKVGRLPPIIKGVKGLTNEAKVVEPVEKGILRALNNVYIFKDGTARFDATDVPMTHFYPKEIGTPIDKLKEMGYAKDYLGNDLVRDDQLVELRHQDVIMNKRGLSNLLNIAKFVDQLLESFYELPKFYNVQFPTDMIGSLVVTLSPHTSCGVLNRVIGYTDANVGFAHPYVISARRRNCDGDEDTTMLLLDALINFSKDYLPESVGGTMDTPLILTVNVNPEEVDDEVHAMEIIGSYGLEFYNKTLASSTPSDVSIEMVEKRLKTKEAYQDLRFTHGASASAVTSSPKKSLYVQLKTMQEKVDAEFGLMDRIYAVNKKDAARRVITSHFIPDLIGNLHSFSRQIFRCSSCNAKYRRVPLVGKCTRDGGKLLLTISKGGIEKYLQMAITLAERYDLDPYIKQRLYLVKDEISDVFVDPEVSASATEGQFSLTKYF